MGAKTRALPNSKGVYFPRDLLASKAYEKLTRLEVTIFNVFYLKRRFPSDRTAKKAHIDKYTVMNNGEIVFPYSEAKGYGINGSTFTRAIDKLVKVGFIDIAKPSVCQGDMVYYSISERWQNYGTTKYRPSMRPKATNGVGVKSRFRARESVLHPQKYG